MLPAAVASPASQRRSVLVLLAALGVSGVAGIVNQVVWQRALKIGLGGSETLSAMVVVLVFMAGLGLGAWLAGRFSKRTRHPLWALALVEVALVVANAAVALVLSLDLSETVYAVQTIALSVGVPLRAVYAVAALVLLGVPTTLMGTTIPLASEAYQRQLGATDGRLVTLLFFVNTVGAAVGALGGSLWLLPYYGQLASLVVAIGLNGLAAVGLGLAAYGVAPAHHGHVAAGPSGASAVLLGASADHRHRWMRRDEVLGLVLGIVSLGYEMLLFRVLALANEPLPHTFAVGLCCFLALWSLGVALAARLPVGVAPVALLTGLVVACEPSLFAWDVQWGLGLVPGALLYAAPCLGFGMVYGQLVGRSAERWGEDVGRYYAANTVGACLGVVGFTLVGYEMPLEYAIGVVALGWIAVGFDELGHRGVRWWRVGTVAAGASVVGLVVYAWQIPYTEHSRWGRTYWGRDGVVEITPDDQVYIDGLWHTKLTDGHDHLGRPYSWVMAVAAVLSHGEQPRTGLVVGAGVGISSVTLAGVAGMQVDGYEINHTIQRVLRDYPRQTLHASQHPQLRWMWRDARSGLALDDTEYDIILSAPLLLRQAGSSLLLSKEYLQLVKSRLAPGGVVAVYSSEGGGKQSWLVQRTVAEVFAHQVTWYDGIVTIAADHPVTITPDDLARRMAGNDRLAAEMRTVDAQIRASGFDGLYAWYEGPPRGPVADRVITDDQPLVEYPLLANEVVQPVSRDALGGR